MVKAPMLVLMSPPVPEPVEGPRSPALQEQGILISWRVTMHESLTALQTILVEANGVGSNAHVEALKELWQ